MLYNIASFLARDLLHGKPSEVTTKEHSCMQLFEIFGGKAGDQRFNEVRITVTGPLA